MIWTGELLYAQYCQRDLELNQCGNDSWADLDPAQRDVWNALAVDVSE